MANTQKGGKQGLDFIFRYARNYLHEVLIIQVNVIIGETVIVKGRWLGDPLLASLEEPGTMPFHADFVYV